MWASAPTGWLEGRPFNGFPATHCRGRRPRRPAFTARPAPAERGGQGIRDLSGPKVSPRAPCLMLPASREGQPSPRRRPEVRALREPTRRGDFFFWTVHGPFSFCQEQKENGGWNAPAIAAFPRVTTGRPYAPEGIRPSSCFQVSTRRQAFSMTEASRAPFSTASITLGIWVR